VIRKYETVKAIESLSADNLVCYFYRRTIRKHFRVYEFGSVASVLWT
jgi:hypothetical protein